MGYTVVKDCNIVTKENYKLQRISDSTVRKMIAGFKISPIFISIVPPERGRERKSEREGGRRGEERDRILEDQGTRDRDTDNMVTIENGHKEIEK